MQVSDIKLYAALNNYLLLGTIGEGGFAKVKLAKCLSTNMTFAIKIFKKTHARYDKRDFIQEVDCMSFVQHKNVPVLIESYESARYVKKNGQSYEVSAIVMEYMPNGDLFNYILVTKGFSDDVARACFRTLIETIGDIHSQGIAHRDLKVENLFFDENFNVKIGDFGLATKFRNSNGLIPLSDRCGTPGFRAPEMFYRKPYEGSAVDIFSCGIILFSLMTGCTPFVEANPRKDRTYSYIATKKYNAFWIYLQAVMKRNFSNEFKDLLTAMLAFAPEERPTIQQIKNHPWYHGPVLEPEEMKTTLNRLKAGVDASVQEERNQMKQAAAKTKQNRLGLFGLEGVAMKK